MPEVRIRETEPFEVAVRRFKRACEKAGIMSEMRRHEFHEKKTWANKREKAQAVKRWLKKLFRDRVHPVRGAKSMRKRKTTDRRRHS